VVVGKLRQFLKKTQDAPEVQGDEEGEAFRLIRTVPKERGEEFPLNTAENLAWKEERCGE